MIEIPGFSPIRRFEQHDDGSVTIHVQPPPIIGKYPEVSVKLTEDQFERYQWWRRGKLIQEALPDLSDDDRELLMTGLRNDDFQRIAHDPEEE
jgi:hypothetical protein